MSGGVWWLAGAFVAEVVLLALVLLSIAYARQRAAQRRDREALVRLVARVREQRGEREAAVERFVVGGLGMDGEQAEDFRHRLLREESALLQRFIDIYRTRESALASRFDGDLFALLDAYHTIQPLAPPAAGEDPGDEEVASDQADEIARLRQENVRLEDELRITMETMSRMLNDYSAMFAAGGEKSEAFPPRFDAAASADDPTRPDDDPASFEGEIHEIDDSGIDDGMDTRAGAADIPVDVDDSEPEAFADRLPDAMPPADVADAGLADAADEGDIADAGILTGSLPLDDAGPATAARPTAFADDIGAVDSELPPPDLIEPEPVAPFPRDTGLFDPEPPRSEELVADDLPARAVPGDSAEDPLVEAGPLTEGSEAQDPTPARVTAPATEVPRASESDLSPDVDVAVADVAAPPPEEDDPIEQILREARSQEEAARERELALMPGKAGQTQPDHQAKAPAVERDDANAATNPGDASALPDDIDLDDLFDSQDDGRQRREG